MTTKTAYPVTVNNYNLLLDCHPDSDSASLWYAKANTIIKENAARHQIRVETYAGIVAALSPLVKWSENIAAAESLISQYESGERVDFSIIPGFNRNKVKALLILHGDDSALSGPKVTQFRDNLLGNDRAITIDVWMLRASAWSQSQATNTSTYTPKHKAYCAMAVRQVSKQRGLPYSAAQAIIWESIKANWKMLKPHADYHTLFDISRYAHKLA